MTDPQDRLVSRSEIARAAGVKRPAVTNWERRREDYPRPASTVGNTSLFRAGDIAEWLDGRTIPVNARLPHEPPGTTYGDRFRAVLGLSREPGATRNDPTRLSADVARLVTRTRRDLPQLPAATRTELLLTLVHRHTWLNQSGPPDEDVRASWPEVDQSTWRRVAAAVAEVPPTPEAGGAIADDLLLRLLDESGRSASVFLTPPSVVRTVVAILATTTAAAPGPLVVRDPACGAAEFLVAAHQALAARDPVVSGSAITEHHRRLARLNLLAHGVEADIRLAPAAPSLGMPDFAVPADVILCNPPFSLRLPDSGSVPGYWDFGRPPARSADFDWLQYVLASLTPGGRAGVVMTPRAAFSSHGERAIRAGMVESGAVECLIALPAGLFTATGIPVTVWLLRRPARRSPSGARREVLFIDASRLGARATRTRVEFTDRDIASLVEAHRSWFEGRNEGVPGLSRAVPIDEIRANGHDLSPRRYVPELVEETERTDRMRELERLTGELARLHVEARQADDAVARVLTEWGT